MLLWVGLGNPGPEHAKQRHNIGFMAVDALALRHGFSPWRQKFKGETAEGSLAGRKILLLKPLTYMNLVGESVRAAAQFHKISSSEILAWHDELDLAPGRIRVKSGGGTAGHNGLRDMQRALGTADFGRVRMGIGHPGHRDRVSSYVLGQFSKDEHWVEPLITAVADAAALLADGREAEFMTRVALVTREPD